MSRGRREQEEGPAEPPGGTWLLMRAVAATYLPRQNRPAGTPDTNTFHRKNKDGALEEQD